MALRSGFSFVGKIAMRTPEEPRLAPLIVGTTLAMIGLALLIAHLT